MGLTRGWKRRWHPTLVLLPGKYSSTPVLQYSSHGRRSLVGCSPWGREESDSTARLHFHFSLLCIGEGNGNPLQCSCLENPRDRGAWWAAVYRVAQSRTRLKRLSSSSNNNNKGQKEVAFKWRVEEVAESPARPGFCSAVIVCVLHGLHMSDWTFEAVKICFYYIRPSTLFSI